MAALQRKNIYFASDTHLGVPDAASSLEREKILVKWLDSIKDDAAELYLLGDIFDFWFEYKHAVPKGFIRLLGKLAELSDAGITVHYFIGNHDMWMFGYLPKEMNIRIYRKPVERKMNGKIFFIGHGDGIGPRDHGYKFIKKVFANRICQWLFARLHPNFGLGLGRYLSKLSRESNGRTDIFLGDEKEYLVRFVKEHEKIKHFDYYIFGHRHLPLDIEIEKAHYFNLGDWITHFSYAVWDGEKLELKKFLS
jgi:UDP-2,3-diacylglucosamine hydrolase